MINNIFSRKIEVKTSKSNKVTLSLSNSNVPKVIHIHGLTIPQIQRAFQIGQKLGSKTIIAITIE
jgi:hypothetical protein